CALLPRRHARAHWCIFSSSRHARLPGSASRHQARISTMDRLTGKVALVTGAARGIGAAIARAFVAEGARVLLTDIDDARGAQTARALGERAAYRRLDVREPSDWDAAMAALLNDWQRLDVLVNNAGITGFEGGAAAHDPEHATLEDWRAVHRTNLDGV